MTAEQHNFWQNRWEQNQIGFHQGDINPYLRRYWPQLNLKAGDRVFVPLCGKSQDLLWLRNQGHPVTGVEIVRMAVEAFFKENNLPVTRAPSGALELWRHPGFDIYCGDFFALSGKELQGVKAVYDRASLIALPPDLRARYAAHLTALLPAGTQVLLVCFDYPQQEMEGPPFCVSADEVRALYEKDFSMQSLHEQDILADNPHFQERGLSRLSEKIYHLRRK